MSFFINHLRKAGGRGVNKTVYLSIITGQSNGEGGGVSPPLTTLPASWRGEQPRIYIWADGTYQTGVIPGTFEKMIPCYNTAGEPPSNGFTPTEGKYWSNEQAFSHALQDYTNSDVYIVKVAEGGLQIVEWEPGGRMRARLDAAIPSAIAELQALVAAGIYDEIIPVCLNWIQGEGNQGMPTAEYEPKLTEVLTHYRSIHPMLANVPILMQRLGAVQTLLQIEAKATVNAAFDNIASALPDAYTLNPDDLAVAVYSDQIHYNAPSRIILGNASFEVIKQNTLS